MLETHLKSPVTRGRLRAGPAADHIDGFADWLHRCGYAPTTIDWMLRCLAGWTDWMLASGFSAQELLSGFEACELALQEKRRVSYSRGANRQSLTAASVFIRFLRQQGELPPPMTPPCASELWPVLGEFRSWMYKHRGLTEATLDIYQRTLVGLCTALGDDAHAYSAEALRAFVLDRARPHGIQNAKSITVAVRSFLRFLGATGQCPPGMEHAIPGFACWQLSAVPRFLDLRAWLAVRGQVPVPELFVNAQGDAMTRAGFEYVLDKHACTAAKTCASLNGRSVSPHQLRHGCAITMLQATRDIRKVALWLGHADTRTTEIYLRVDPLEKLDAMEAVLPLGLRRGRFKAPDALIASLFEPE